MARNRLNAIRSGLVKRQQNGCDQCQMVAINGVATHEHGCPNVKRSKQGECKECGNAVPHGEQCTCWDYEA